MALFGSEDLSHDIMLNNSKITSSKEEKLFGILLDSKQNFESFPLKKSRPKNKCLTQVKELSYIRSKKLSI